MIVTYDIVTDFTTRRYHSIDWHNDIVVLQYRDVYKVLGRIT